MKDIIQKYIVCYLQQDDPKRRLFRVRPLFSWDGHTVQPIEDAETDISA